VAIVTPPMLILNSRLKSRAERAIKHWIASNRGYSANVLRTMRSIRLIRTRGADAAELEQARERVTTLRATGLEKSWASNVAQVLNGTIATVTGSLILVVGGVAVARGSLALSQLLTFYAVIALLLRNVTGVSGSGAHLFVAASSLIPLQAIADNPTPRIYSGTQQVPFDGSVSLVNVEPVGAPSLALRLPLTGVFTGVELMSFTAVIDGGRHMANSVVFPVKVIGEPGR
jgi:ATP-binding cassette subfamily B protein